jgi:septal ring factor EnvC (AmiA/AmiB activator)
MMADYIKACCLSTPEEMKTLRDARGELARTKTALASETAKLMAAERSLQRSSIDLLAARAKISDLEGALDERNNDLAEMTVARNRWRRLCLTTAIAMLLILMLRQYF